MELPILSQAYQPTAEAMVRSVGRAGELFARTVAQETSLTGATAYCNPNKPGLHSANYAAQLCLPQGCDAQTVLDEVAAFFDNSGVSLRTLEAAGPTWPGTLAREAQGRGFSPVVGRVYRLQQHRPRSGAAFRGLQIIPARAAYRPLREYCYATALAAFSTDEKRAADTADAVVDYLDEPRLEMSVGRIDGAVRCVAGVMSLGETGVVYAPEALNADTAVAAAMIDHVLAACARAGMKQVILERHDGSDSIPFYESIGFQQVASMVRYHRPSPGESNTSREPF